MADGSSTVDSAEMIDLLMSNVDRSVPILIENVNDNPHSFFPASLVSSSVFNQPTTTITTITKVMSPSIWGKSLINIPLFGLREIECHRLKSGKNPDSAIIKTL